MYLYYSNIHRYEKKGNNAVNGHTRKGNIEETKISAGEYQTTSLGMTRGTKLSTKKKIKSFLLTAKLKRRNQSPLSFLSGIVLLL